MNFRRKSTVGFSIGNILLDLLGGVTNYAQMAVQSIDQRELSSFTTYWLFSLLNLYGMPNKLLLVISDSWVNFYGNIGKTLLSLVSHISSSLQPLI